MFARPTAVRRLMALTAAVFAVAVVAGISAAANVGQARQRFRRERHLSRPRRLGRVRLRTAQGRSGAGLPEPIRSSPIRSSSPSSSTNVSNASCPGETTRACSSPVPRASAARTRPVRPSVTGRCSRCTPSTRERRWNTPPLSRGAQADPTGHDRHRRQRRIPVPGDHGGPAARPRSPASAAQIAAESRDDLPRDPQSPITRVRS